MKNFCAMLFFSILALVSVSAHASYGVHEDHPYHFTISKNVYTFNEIYQISSPNKDTYPGSIKKGVLRVRTNYDLSNQQGWQATGIVRALSLGAVYAWATDVDIYDTRGVKIGMIDGELATTESGKFSLYDYDESGHAALVGVAYANADFNRFVVFRSSSDPHPVAELTRNPLVNTWSVTVHYPEMMDDRIIRIFAGFVVDYQDKFLTQIDVD